MTEPSLYHFALTGAAGYIAPRHMEAIRSVGGRLVAALDPHDSVGVLDRMAPGCRYFQDSERFDRHLYKLRRGGVGVDYVSVCSPNYLHDSHARMAMRNGADVICEKPLVLSPWNLDALAEMERETGKRVFTVLQLRLNPILVALKAKIAANPGYALDADLTYVTPRGPWYLASWKGDESRSGGILANLGVHMFDLMLWLFGPATSGAVEGMVPTRASGHTYHVGAGRVTWTLAVDGTAPCRRLTIGGDVIDLSDGFTDAHDRVYAETLAGRGFGIEDARPAVELIHRLRSQWGPAYGRVA